MRLVSFDALKQPAHLALNPFGQIPTLEDEGLVLFESGAIVLHLAERHAGLLPEAPDARARAMELLAQMHEKVREREERRKADAAENAKLESEMLGETPEEVAARARRAAEAVEVLRAHHAEKDAPLAHAQARALYPVKRIFSYFSPCTSPLHLPFISLISRLSNSDAPGR